MTNFLVQAEASFAAAERVQELASEAPAEAARRTAADEAVPEDWPAGADVVFESVAVRYQPHLPRVLEDFSVRIPPRSRVGVVGRTGSGKSTLLQALLRLVELDAGRILVGGVDLKTLGVATVRERVALVPQDPLLFAGTLRSNLDLAAAHADADLLKALEGCGMASLVAARGGLDAAVEFQGRNWSLGERQCFCLARALLRRAPIVLLDEATASMDPESDRRLQAMLRADKGALTLTIAHRLNTVADADLLLVLDGGRLAEVGAPAVLRESGGHYSRLAQSAEESLQAR